MTALYKPGPSLTSPHLNQPQLRCPITLASPHLSLESEGEEVGEKEKDKASFAKSTPTVNALAAEVCIKLEAMGADLQIFTTALAAAARARQRNALKARVYAACLKLSRSVPPRAINRDFFHDVGQAPGVGRSGSVVEQLYYEAVRDGLPSIFEVRWIRP